MKDKIREQIISANKAYRLGRPIMDDIDFDNLCEEYRDMISEEEWNEFRNSLHEETGKIKHPFVMGSLDKLKVEEPDNIFKWISSYVKSGEISVSAKIDGISCRIHYDGNGEFQSATTRGDGYHGIDITDKVKFIKGVPRLTALKNADVRGELVITNDDFENIKNILKNPRNACAGIMGQKTPDPNLLKYVSFICYEVMGGKIFKDTQFVILEKNGFCTSKNWIVDSRDVTIDEFTSWCKADYGYPTDGLVVSDIEYLAENEYRPKAQRAIKLSTKLSGISVLRDIDWSRPSKDGRMTPVGLIDPINLGGATISRVTLNNLDWIEANDLKIGSKVHVSRSNDVIPKIIDVENDGTEKAIQIPKKCPICGTELVVDGVDLRCPNDFCDSKKFIQVKNFIVKLGIKNVNLKTIENWDLDSIQALLDFKPDRNYKTQIHFSSDLNHKLFNTNEIDLFKSMNFRNVAEKTLDKIIDFYGYKALLDWADGEIDFQQTKIGYPQDVGQKTIDSFKKDGIKNINLVRLIMSDKRYAGKKYNEVEKTESISSNGKSVCFTGALETMTRKEASALAEKNGFTVASGVNKTLTYLVTNTPDSGSSKNRAAQKFGTKIITEKDFLAMCNR